FCRYHKCFRRLRSNIRRKAFSACSRRKKSVTRTELRTNRYHWWTWTRRGRGEVVTKMRIFAVCIAFALFPNPIAQGPPASGQPKNPSESKATVKQEVADVSSGAKPSAAGGKPKVPDDFIIGPEDVLQITVWREPDLGTRGVVRPDGKIGVTLLGDVQ